MANSSMPSRILSAWREGTLVPGWQGSTASSDERIEHMGRGESYDAWAVHPADGVALTIRIPWRDADLRGADMERELEALHRLPPGIGPEPLAVHPQAATSPLGAPCLVTGHRPGRALLPSEWTAQHLRRHAHHLARLHGLSRLHGSGNVPDAWPRSPTWDEETSTLFEEALRELDAEGDPHRLREILQAAARQCRRAAPRIDGIASWTLCHGDLCATNILWDDGACSYIDFEWSRTDDPARDLAIIGGAVHGGPWYVPLDEEQVSGFVADYRQGVTRLLGEVEEAGALRERMHGWTVYERSSMLVHLSVRSRDSAEHRRILPAFRAAVAALVGTD